MGERVLFGRGRPACPTCGHVVFLSPHPAAGCCVLHDGRVLMVRRRYNPALGDWCFPAGYVEWDETIEAAAAREVEEETGLQVEVGDLVSAASYFESPTRHGVIVLFEARVLGGTLTPADDALEAAFFPLDAPPPNIAFETHRLALARLRQRVASRQP